TLATAVRSLLMSVVLAIVCTATRSWAGVANVHGRALSMIALSAVAGALSWLCYFCPLQIRALSHVAPIGKLSLPFAILLAVLFLNERPSLLNWIGIALISGGGYLATLKR